MEYPTFKAAAVQASPVFMDTGATVDKARQLIREAAQNGAELVAFPEVFVPAYPYWSWILSPVAGGALFEQLYKNSIAVPGPEVERLCAAARQHHCHVVIGVNERDPKRMGTLFNTNLIIGPEGELLGRHRKLVPTWAEKLTWSGGDGSSLKVYDTAIGPLGTLACGENTNPLARFTLLSQGELVHVANYIGLPVAPKDYNMAEAIKLRGATHSFEGKLFTVISCSTISEEMIRYLENHAPQARELLQRESCAFSGIIGPDGRVIGDALIDDEGIVYADIDLNKCIQPKQMHDLLGHYNRFDIFKLSVNTSPLNPVTFCEADGRNADQSDSNPGDSDSVASSTLSPPTAPDDD